MLAVLTVVTSVAAGATVTTWSITGNGSFLSLDLRHTPRLMGLAGALLIGRRRILTATCPIDRLTRRRAAS